MRDSAASSDGGSQSTVVRVVGFLLVVPAVMRRPQRGLLLLAATTPFDGLLVLLDGPGLLAGWKEALMGVTVVAALLHRGRGPGAPDGRHMPWWPALVLLAVGGTISAVATAGLAGVIAIKITFFWTTTLVVLRLAPFTARDRDRLVTVLMSVGAVTAAVGLWQQVVGSEYLVSLGYSYDTEVRFAGGFFRSFSTFNQPFPFALYLAMSLLVGGAVALAHPRRPRNALFLIATPLLLAGMATSIVRGAALALGVGVLWLAALRFRRLIWPAVAAAVAAGAVAFFLLPAGALGTALSPASFGERTATWASVLSEILAAPLGQGLGTTGSAAEAIAALNGDIAPTPIPDNYYVKVLSELGPLGLWLLVLLLLSALAWTARVARRLQGPDAALAIGVSASVASVLAASLVATYLEIFPLDLYFWLLLGAVACAEAQAGPGPGRPAAARVEAVPSSASGS